MSIGNRLTYAQQGYIKCYRENDVKIGKQKKERKKGCEKCGKRKNERLEGRKEERKVEKIMKERKRKERNKAG